MSFNCQYCGKESETERANKAHERWCTKNPNSVKPSRKKETVAIITSESEQEPPKHPLVIVNVQEVKIGDNLLAYFKIGEKTFAVPPCYHGAIVGKDGSIIPTLLITTADGLLLPPSMSEGFIGMFPANVPESAEDRPKEITDINDTEGFKLQQGTQDTTESISDRIIEPPKEEPKPEVIKTEPATSRGILDRIMRNRNIQ